MQCIRKEATEDMLTRRVFLLRCAPWEVRESRGVTTGSQAMAGLGPLREKARHQDTRLQVNAHEARCTHSTSDTFFIA
jgi:hypothetical protein